MKLDMVGLVVEDMAKAVTFYETLGFTVSEERGADYLELINEGVRLSLNSREMVASIYGFFPEKNGDTIELAFLCHSPAEVDQKVAVIQAAGYEVFKAPWDAFWGQRYSIIKDVDGNLLSLFANLPEETR